MSRELRSTERSRLRRLPARGHHDRDTVDAILDAARICHVAFVDDGSPVVVPMLHVRVDDHLYVHGSPAARVARGSREGLQTCLSVTLVDGLVLARSAFHHSMNYRSVVLYGRMELVENDREKRHALHALVERTWPGRSAGCRPPSEEELRRTSVLRLDIDEGAAKVRTGPPIDDEEDLLLDHWAGVIPIETVLGCPVPDPELRAGIELPDSMRHLCD